MTKASDIGEITGAAQDLRTLLESGEGYRLAVEAVEDYAIFTMDPQGRVTSWNPGAERLLEYKADEILGHEGA
jgi:PAS domain S-box-containing protein